MCRFEYMNLEYYTIIESTSYSKCRVCDEETKYIDYCCECAICSTECYNELMNRIAKKI